MSNLPKKVVSREPSSRFLSSFFLFLLFVSFGPALVRPTPFTSHTSPVGPQIASNLLVSAGPCRDIEFQTGMDWTFGHSNVYLIIRLESNNERLQNDESTLEIVRIILMKLQFRELSTTMRTNCLIYLIHCRVVSESVPILSCSIHSVRVSLKISG